MEGDSAASLMLLFRVELAAFARGPRVAVLHTGYAFIGAAKPLPLHNPHHASKTYVILQ